MSQAHTPNRALRIGIVGCGTVTQTSYARTLSGTGPWSVTAVTDLDPEAAAAAATLFRCEALSFDELVEKVDAVMIATPPSTHLALVSKALARVPLVFCEKPFVARTEDAHELIALADRCGSRLLVGHFRRAFPSVQLARTMITSGVLGAVESIEAFEGGRFTWHARSGYTESDPSGGVIFDTGSHTLDMALFATGLDSVPMDISVDVLTRDRAEPSHELTARGSLDSRGTRIGFTIHVSRLRALANRIHVKCQHGSVDLPVGPGRNIRVSGQRGSGIIAPPAQIAGYDHAYIRQWHLAFGAAHDDTLNARSFVNLTHWLQRLSETA